jgi:DNA-binding MltR family transcriptional regulator
MDKRVAHTFPYEDDFLTCFYVKHSKDVKFALDPLIGPDGPLLLRL